MFSDIRNIIVPSFNLLNVKNAMKTVAKLRQTVYFEFSASLTQFRGNTVIMTLTAYFASVDEGDKPGGLRRLVDHFNEPFTKLTLLFLQYVLPILTEFNKLFQVITVLITELLLSYPICCKQS